MVLGPEMSKYLTDKNVVEWPGEQVPLAGEDGGEVGEEEGAGDARHQAADQGQHALHPHHHQASSDKVLSKKRWGISFIYIELTANGNS